jgi:1-acyl-sn-glycerol-3-phosphate acyltransferase
MTILRSALFWLALLLVTPPYAILALACAPLPRMVRYRVISGWSRLMLWCLRTLCGIAGGSRAARICHPRRR